MKLSLRTIGKSIAELTIETSSVTLVEDLANYAHYKENKYAVYEGTIESFISIAHELSKFNGTTDIDFVRGIIDRLLNDTEKNELFEQYTKTA